MSENMEVMAGEMSQPKKVAFANRKYSNEERRQRDEEELEQIVRVFLETKFEGGRHIGRLEKIMNEEKRA